MCSRFAPHRHHGHTRAPRWPRSTLSAHPRVCELGQAARTSAEEFGTRRPTLLKTLQPPPVRARRLGKELLQLTYRARPGLAPLHGTAGPSATRGSVRSFLDKVPTVEGMSECAVPVRPRAPRRSSPSRRARRHRCQRRPAGAALRSKSRAGKREAVPQLHQRNAWRLLSWL